LMMKVHANVRLFHDKHAIIFIYQLITGNSRV
jgi:hypothetical protein